MVQGLLLSPSLGKKVEEEKKTLIFALLIEKNNISGSLVDKVV